MISRAGVRAAYGDPVELDGTTILPVAFTTFGFGSGKAKLQAEDENGEARESDEPSDGDMMAGGGVSLPLGAYVTRDGYTRFEPNPIPLIVVAIPFVCVLGRAIRKIIRVLKK